MKTCFPLHFVVLVLFILDVNKAKSQDLEQHKDATQNVGITETTTFDTVDIRRFYIEAQNLKNSSQYQKALKRLDKAERLHLEMIGKSDTTLANIYNLSGVIKRNSGNYDAALESYEQSLQIRIDLLGEHHPIVATCHDNIAVAYRHKREYELAKKHARKALTIKLQSFGNSHIELASTYNNLGIIERNQSNYDQSYYFHQKALQNRLKNLGNCHVDVAWSYHHVGVVQRNKGQYKQALGSFYSALDIRHSIYDSKHSDIASSYDNIGIAWRYLKDYTQALKYYFQALKIKKSIRDTFHSSIATSYDNIAKAYESDNQKSKAIDYYKMALNIKKSNGIEPIKMKSEYRRIGKLLSDNGMYADAALYIDSALQLCKIHECAPDKLLTLNYINGTIQFRRGFYTKAHQSFLAAYNLIEANTNEIKEVKVLNSLGLAANSIGRNVEAESYITKSLQLSLKTGDPISKQVMTAYNSLGSFQYQMGNLSKSATLFQKALEINISLNGEFHIDNETLYNNIGFIHSERNSYFESLEFYNKALQIAYAHYPDYHPGIAMLLGNTIQPYLEIKQPEKALVNAVRAREIADSIGVYTKTSFFAHNNLGRCFQELERFQEAKDSYEHAANIVTKIYGKDHYQLITIFDNLGSVCNEMGRQNEARKNYAKAIQLGRSNKHTIKTAHAYANAASFESNISNPAGAVANYKSALGELDNNSELDDVLTKKIKLRFFDFMLKNEEFIDTSDLKMLQKDLFSNTGYIDALDINDNLWYYSLLRNYYILKYGFEQVDSILFANMKLINVIDNNLTAFQYFDYNSTYSGGLYQYLESCIQDLFRLEVARNKLTFRLAEILKGRRISQKINQQSYTTSFGIPDSLREQEYDLSVDLAFYEKKKYQEEHENKVQNDSLINVYDDKLFDLNRQQDDLMELLKTKYSNYHNARYSQKVISVSGVQDTLLNDNQALVEYFVGDSSIFTFTILHDTFFVQEIKKDFPLEKWVEDMLHGIYGPYVSSTAESERTLTFAQASNKLYEHIFYPVDTLLPEGTDIILVPDGILGYIPFDALLTDSTKTDSYLIRDHEFSYAYSATLQAEMLNMKHDRRAKKTVLAFAPSFNQQEETGDTVLLAARFIDVSNQRNWLGPLKYNDDEVLAISTVAATDLYLDSMATKQRFLQSAGDYQIVHLSTHGKANDKMGDYSFLAFYDENDSTENLLYNRELYGLDLNADMVVLSACETGIGELQKGEGIISLARGFSYAGAKSIMTTLWSVNDQSTKILMELFYGYLKEGKRKDEALRQAKLDYIDQYPHLGTDPYFWAGIIPIGDMGPVELNAQTPWWWYTLGFVGIAFLSFSFMRRKALA